MVEPYNNATPMCPSMKLLRDLCQAIQRLLSENSMDIGGDIDDYVIMADLCAGV